jgi:hypothetical protein
MDEKRFITITAGNFHAGDIVTIRDVFSDILNDNGFLTVADVSEYVSVRQDYVDDCHTSEYGWNGDEDFHMRLLCDGGVLFDAPMPIRKPHPNKGVCTPCSFGTDNKDMVNHPTHYQSNTGLEVIEAIEAFVADPASYYVGNIIKYICRYRHKNGIEDIKKAGWYLDRLTEHLEKESNNYV